MKHAGGNREMKKKVSDYIADYLAEQGIRDFFTVTGGMAMHLNDSFGHHSGLRCTYHHHEQAAAMAAEAYARVNNQMAAVCVTAGPGATNAITGVLCGWMDSIPMLVISGQVRFATTSRSTGLRLRTLGVQEYDIVQSVGPMTKYAVMVTSAEMVRYHLEKALYLARAGRPGPVWLDIPLDIQGAVIETDDLKAYVAVSEGEGATEGISDEVIDTILAKIRNAKRPVLFVGNGVRLAGAIDEFRELVDALGVPVVTGMSSVDAMESSHPLFVGRNGTTGDRAGNFAVQNSDVLLSIGSRQGLAQTGFQYQSWAREAYTILNDIDPEELKKPGLHVSLAVCGDAKDLIRKLLARVKGKTPWFTQVSWGVQCRAWKTRYPVVTKRHYETVEDGCTNIYAFYQELSKCLQENAKVVVSVGTARVAGSQAMVIKKGQRLITNPNTAAMGYGLPAAIGVARACPGEDIVCVTGDGSLQMNIQELQTIIQNRLPVKIFVINNQGYHSIRQTQKGFFGKPFVGIGEESGDLSFPQLEKLVPAYGFPYCSCRDSGCLENDIGQVLSVPGAVVCEVFVTKEQFTEPKTSSKRLPDGEMFSAPLEDMYPFLSRGELQENMFIPLVDEGQL